MSLDDIIRSIDNHRQHFYLSGQAPCPYYSDRFERQLFTSIDENTPCEFLDALNNIGFRRSQNMMYRPACDGCRACMPVRINAATFQWSYRWRRILGRNKDLHHTIDACEPNDRVIQLFARYLHHRHPDSMMNQDQAISLPAVLAQCPKTSQLHQFYYESNALAAAVIVDNFGDGPSAVYSFFDPHAAKRSLGSYIILTLIKAAIDAQLPYVYLGYWIADHEKMDYKKQFQPLETLGQNGWQVAQT